MSAELSALAARGQRRSYRRGVVLIHEGDQGDTLFVVLSGALRVFSRSDNGRELTFGSYGPGEFVGEMSLDGGPRAASVETTAATVCAVVTRSTLHGFIAEHPAFAFELLAKLIRRARAATLSARQMALNDVYGRLKGLLESLAEPAPDAVTTTQRWLPQHPTHRALAQQLGCSREMVSRLLKDLVDGGYVVEDGPGWRLPRGLPLRW